MIWITHLWLQLQDANVFPDLPVDKDGSDPAGSNFNDIFLNQNIEYRSDPAGNNFNNIFLNQNIEYRHNFYNADAMSSLI